MRTCHVISVFAAVSLAGCTLEDIDTRARCPGMTAVMTSDSIVSVDSLDQDDSSVANAIRDGLCPQDNMKCAGKVCVLTCTQDKNQRAFYADDGACSVYMCTEGFWSLMDKKSCADLEGERCEGSDVSYANDHNSRCQKVTCADGRKVIDKSCSFSCTKDGDAFTGCGACINDALTCADGAVMKCENGRWSLDRHCENGCTDGRCNACADNAVSCREGRLYRCVDHVWDDGEACPSGCANDTSCVECLSGSDRCHNGAMQTCVKGSWVERIQCADGCKDGVSCNTPKIPQPGDLCNEAGFLSICHEGRAYRCENGQVVMWSCNESVAECVEFESGADCALRNESMCEDIEKNLPLTLKCSNGVYSYISCEKTRLGNVMGRIVSGTHGCFSQFGRDYHMSCDSNGVMVVEKCSACTIQSDGSAQCTKPVPDGAHKLDDPCTNEHSRTCDGDTLIECNGSKYVAVYLDSTGNSMTCEQASMHDTKKAYCDTIASLNMASCSVTCDEDQLTLPHSFSSKCANGKFDVRFCEKGDSGKYSTFDGNLALSICQDRRTLIYCENEGMVRKTCSCKERNWIYPLDDPRGGSYCAESSGP